VDGEDYSSFCLNFYVCEISLLQDDELFLLEMADGQMVLVATHCVLACRILSSMLTDIVVLSVWPRSQVVLHDELFWCFGTNGLKLFNCLFSYLWKSAI